MDFDSHRPQVPRKRARLRIAVLVLAPFLLVVACMGVGGFAIGWLGERAVTALLYARVGAVPELAGIPVTGGEGPTPPPGSTPSIPPDSEAPGYLLLVQEQMSICYDSFGAFVDLEQLVFEEPALFQDAEYRQNAQQAVDLFRDDCQALYQLPEAPPAYAELDLWLRRSADEAGLAAESFSHALEAGQTGVFESRSMHLTVEHLLNFIDYTHNAASVLETISQRRDL